MSSILYQNFDLLIERNGERYRAHVTGSPSGEANTFFDLPDTTTDNYQMIGEQLFHSIFSQDVGKCLALSWQKTQLAGTGLRLRLRIDNEASELATLPWELLYSPDWQRFLVLSHKTPLVRYILQTRDDPPLLVKGPLRILVVMSAPKDFANLQGNRESKLLSNALSEFVAQGSVSIEQLHSATLEAVQDRLRKGDVHILHFIGHGYFDEANDEGGLYLEDESGHSCPVGATDLATVLCDATLRLVFLNACEGAVGGQTNFFAGVAQKLVQQQIPAVIAMQYRITDSAALRLSHTFYKALADGYPVDAALTEARKAVFTTGEHPELAEWATAILFSRSPDNQLFARIETNALATSQGQQTTLVTEQTANREDVTNIAGNVNVGRDFVGRDQIVQGNVTKGDKIAGDKIVNNYYVTLAEHDTKPISPPTISKNVRQSFEPETLLIPAGSFWMGSDEGPEYERPRHQLTLAAYLIGKYPVTTAEYAAFTQDQPENRPRGGGWRFTTPPADQLDQPVTAIRWSDAVAYCTWLRAQSGQPYCLASEAEWEKALQMGIINSEIREWTTTIWGDEASAPTFCYPYRADGRDNLSVQGVYRIWRRGVMMSAQQGRGFASPTSRLNDLGLRVVLAVEPG